MVRKGITRAAAGVAVVGGALAGLNALSAMRRPELQSPVEATERWLDTDDGGVLLYERGDGPTVLLVHSFNAAASAFEMKPIFDRLAQDHRVVAFDWLGFGLSDRPNLRYTPEVYQRVFRRVLAAAGPGPIDVVSLSLPSQYVAVEAAADPGRFRRLVFISPTGFGRFGAKPAGLGAAVREGVLRSPVVGSAIYNALATRLSIEWFERQIFADPEEAPAELLEYSWVTSHQPGARWAPSAFVAGLLNVVEAEEAYRSLRVPAIMIFGDTPRFCDPEAARAVAAENPVLSVIEIRDSGDLPQFEQPQQTFAAIEGFLDEAAGAGVSAPRRRDARG